MDFFQAFLTVTIVHLLAAASPGPDFVMVTQQSLSNGRRAGMLVSLGIALGLSVHILYSSLGMAALVSESSEILIWMKYLAAGFLAYMGIRGLMSKPASGEVCNLQVKREPGIKLISIGFLCNALNPKAPLYFVSLFTLVLSPQMPVFQLFLLGIWMMLVQLFWFGAVSFVLSKPTIQKRFRTFSHWIDRVMGSLLFAGSLRLLLTETK
ncbi:MFS transporter [Veronia nyctiphanis]|uniref:MFS transporter n=1 Tax=Veronia nyctiphanis TaxID=1278244 RepID=A0A4Q0YNR0_9GAMM|nr:LysE family translocator [Veronia nyctiphanis]RXJ71584.1 MFS transporter [Veronia nyctiphanis]